MRTAVYRLEHFNAAHRLHNPTWSDSKNQLVFGKCNNPNYHGHNYQVEVCLIGEVDPETGFVLNLKILRDLIKEKVLNRLDHKNLNLDVEEFKTLNPTAEHIVRVIYNLLRCEIDQAIELKIKLYETERNYVQYPA